MGWASFELDSIDGTPVIIKRTTYDATLEADGLRALANAGAPVPQVFRAEKDHLAMARVSSEPRWGELGEALAEVHRATWDQFGYPIDNVIGSLPQPNSPNRSWGEFFAENRVRCHLEDPRVPKDLVRRLNAACDGPLQELLEEHAPSPSLVHGDLWAGNVIDGWWLIDPAVSYSDREVELAFMEVFGGFPKEIWDSYNAAWPLPDSWLQRRPALQLHHLLVHVRLFGGGYAGMVADRLDRLGW